MIRVSSDTEMTNDLLDELIEKHKIEVNERLGILNDAYLGIYDIMKNEKASFKPNNKVVVNFAKYLTDTMNGFFMGVPVSVTVDIDNETEKTKVQDYLEMINAYNSINDQNAEISKLSSIFGTAYEMYYTNEEARICITKVSPMEGFMVYDDSIIPKKKFFIRYYKNADDNEIGSCADDRVVKYFKRDLVFKMTGEEKEHGFGEVPAEEFKENEEKKGLYEGLLTMINEYNKALSEKANDVDYFADAYLKILGAGLDEETLNKLRDNRIINLDPGDSGKSVTVDFLNKPDSDNTQENLLNRLERLIFTMGMVADMSDDTFGTASGVAIRYKLWAMDSLARTKERKYEAALGERYRMIFGHALSDQYVKRDDWMKLRYRFTRNYPQNIGDEASVAKQLEGVVSKETQLSTLSFVENPSAEIDKMNQEVASQMESLGFNEQ